MTVLGFGGRTRANWSRMVVVAGEEHGARSHAAMRCASPIAELFLPLVSRLSMMDSVTYRLGAVGERRFGRGTRTRR